MVSMRSSQAKHCINSRGNCISSRRQPCITSELGYSPSGEDTLTLRLTSELVDLRAGYAHTACGILPSEDVEIVAYKRRNKNRIFTPSGNTHALAARKAHGSSTVFERTRLATKKQKDTDFRGVLLLLAAELGFEPRHTESESAVLPLHNSAIFTLLRGARVSCLHILAHKK